MTAPFPMVEKALRELIDTKMTDVTREQIGGDLSYESTDEFYIWIGLVTGQATAIDGRWVIDIDVFDSHYTQAMERALALEAILLARGGHRTSLMVLDNVEQNESPTSRPWDDENAFRVGATYSFTARRRAGVPDTTYAFVPVGGQVYHGDGPPAEDFEANPGDRYIDDLTGDLYVME